MVNGTATLVVDLGNSSTRVITKFGLSAKGNPMWRLNILDNRFGRVPENRLETYLSGDVYDASNSRLFRYNDVVYANGELCNTEFGSMTIRPTALEKKYKSLVTSLTLVNAFCSGYEAISAFTNSDISAIDVNWKVVLLLPPDDIETGAKQLAELVKKITNVEFLLPEINKNITIEGVNVFPEGFAAYVAVLFETKSQVREDYKYLLDPSVTTLICDIGAGTTDFALARGANVVSSSRFTREVGGNNVHQRVRRLMKEKGIQLADSAVRLGCERGYVMSGAKKVPIIKEIATAKSDVSRQLVDAVQEFFEDNMMPIQSINNILVVGGGAEVSGVEGIEPIANYIIDFMKMLSSDINLVEIPAITINGNNDGKPTSPRLLNILGASILAG